jgi:hypothetical protein
MAVLKKTINLALAAVLIILTAGVKVVQVCSGYCHLYALTRHWQADAYVSISFRTG